MNPFRWNRAVVGWAMYDFANSAFATVVVSVVFSVYFARTVVPEGGAAIGGLRIPGESLWAYLVSGVMLVVILLSPALGARADRGGSAKSALGGWALLGVLGTVALFTVTPGRVGWACFVVFVAFLGYEMSLVFYNAMLNSISSPSDRGRASGWGFAFGYAGGGLCLALALLLLFRPASLGLPSDGDLPVRATALVVAAWWAAFSLPTFLWVPAPAPLAASPTARRPVFALWREVWSRPAARRFLVAYFLYNDGVQTVLLMAAIFGAKELGMSTAELALCFLLIQFVALPGAAVFGRLADGWGHKKAVMLALAVFCAVTAWGVAMRRPAEFWGLGVAVGFVLGGSQSASRSLFAGLIPAGKAGEFFAFYAVVGKAAALLGPFAFGVASHAWGLRAGVASLLLFFVPGMILLRRVPDEAGRDALRGPRIS